MDTDLRIYTYIFVLLLLLLLEARDESFHSCSSVAVGWVCERLGPRLLCEHDGETILTSGSLLSVVPAACGLPVSQVAHTKHEAATSPVHYARPHHCIRCGPVRR